MDCDTGISRRSHPADAWDYLRFMKPNRILSLTIIGGFLDGMTLRFDTGLNCIIGARGTGKTTVLELIRYALDQLPRKELSAAARRRVEMLVESNLQGGRVELEVETRDGLRCIITRAVGEDPIVLDAKRNTTALSVKNLGFFHAEIFSQNEVETIADQGRFQLDLIDSFAPAEVVACNQQIQELRHQIKGMARQAEPLDTKVNTLHEDARQLPLVEEKLKAFANVGGDDAQAVNQAHERKALRDRETRALIASEQSLAAVEDELAAYVGRIRVELSGKFPKDMLDGPNGTLLSDVVDKLRQCMKAVDVGINKVREDIASILEALEVSARELREAHNGQDIEFRKLIEKHKQHQTQSVERTNLERRRNEFKESQRQAVEVQGQINKLDKKRKELLDQLSEARDRRFVLRRKIADKLNAALNPDIRVSVNQDGNTEDYQALIETTLKSMRVQQGVIAKKLTPLLPPAQLASLVRRADVTGLIKGGELNSDQAAKLIQAFSLHEKLAELETVELHDAPTIELRDGSGYKDSASLSTGQKCTTILPILLLENANPLLIDQPEDNLDNRFVFKTVVENIRKAKLTRQLIFITHNPNIPVLGDAGRVMVMESDGEHARNTKAGTVDECQSQIITLLEGGEEAFRQRGERYNFAA